MDKILGDVRAKRAAGDLFAARAVAERGLAAAPGAAELRKELCAINRELYLGKATPVGTTYYAVLPGDSLSKIATKFAITPELLRRLNALKGDGLNVGQKLKVVKGPFDVRVEKRSFTLEVVSEGKLLFTYRVCLGKENSTPTGTFAAGTKLTNPTQFDQKTRRAIKFGSPDHTIGTRWITFSGQYGLHGTVEPESIGKEMSEGCVRMLNEHIEELYDLLVPGKSTVTIVESFADVKKQEKKADGAPAPKA